MMGLASEMPALADKIPAKQSRVRVRQQKTRIRLLRSAYSLMSVKGVDETTIQEITDTADIGFGTFYNYFSSKDEIASQVLDCVIHNIGQRNVAANQAAGITDPVLIISNSFRLVAREATHNPMWGWWAKRPDLLAERMRLGFKPFAIRDMHQAIDNGAYSIPGNDAETTWSLQIWILTGSIKDIVDGYSPDSSEMLMAESLLRMAGVDRDIAQRHSQFELVRSPDLDIDFSFEI